MDITAFTKIEVAGEGAEAMLQRLVANRLPRRVGGIALTHLLNHRGRIEIEVTIIRLAEDRFYIVCAAFFEQRLLDHLAREGGGEKVDVINRSTGWAARRSGPEVTPGARRCYRRAARQRLLPLSAQDITITAAASGR